MKKLQLLMLATLCLLVMRSNSYVYSAQTDLESPEQILEKVRTNSVCALKGFGETAIAWIRTQALDEEDVSVRPMIMQRTMSTNAQGNVEETVKSWYSQADHAGNDGTAILRVQADTRGLTYLTIMPEGGSNAKQYMYATEFRKIKKLPSVNLMDTIPGTALPNYVLTLCANLAPGKYILKQEELVLKGEPKVEFSNLPSFRAEFSTADYLLKSLAIELNGEQWKFHIPQYKKFSGMARPIVMSSENEKERSIIIFSQWKSDETHLSFNPMSLEQPFGISTDQPTGEQVAAVH